MDEDLKKAKEILKKYDQEQLLQKYEDLTDENKQILLNQILSIDFDEVNKLYEQTKKKVDLGDIKIEPIDFVEKSKIPENEKETYRKAGETAIKNGKYAVVTMAGGQGTRLRT